MSEGKVMNSTDKRSHNGPTKSTAEIRRGRKDKDLNKDPVKKKKKKNDKGKD